MSASSCLLRWTECVLISGRVAQSSPTERSSSDRLVLLQSLVHRSPGNSLLELGALDPNCSLCSSSRRTCSRILAPPTLSPTCSTTSLQEMRFFLKPHVLLLPSSIFQLSSPSFTTAPHALRPHRPSSSTHTRSQHAPNCRSILPPRVCLIINVELDDCKDRAIEYEEVE